MPPPPFPKRVLKSALFAAWAAFSFSCSSAFSLFSRSSELSAAAFVASGLDPAQWDQAIEELLREMADDPNGQAALAIRAADARRCPSGGER